MKRAALYSLVMHVIFALFFLFGLPNPFKSKTIDSQPLLIDFVQIAEKSAAPVLTPKSVQESKAPEKEEVPEPEPAPQEQAEQMPTEQPVKEREPEPVKEEPLQKEPEPTVDEDAEPLPELKPKKKPEPEKKPEPKKPEPPKEKKEDTPKADLTPAKVKKRPTPSKPKALQTLDKKLDSILDNTDDKPKKKKASKSFDDVLDALEKDGEAGIKGAPAQSVSDTLTGSEIDAIRRTIYKCWIVPAGARGAKDLVVDVDMSVAPDGTVTKASVSDKSRMSDPAYRTAAESAVRAVLDPACNPLPIPEDKYEQFKELTLSFNPKDMF